MEPKVGMNYEDVKKRLKRIHSIQERKVKNPQLRENLTNSLLNQARLHEGEGSVDNLIHEVNDNCSGSRRGYSSKYSNRWDKINW